MAKFSFNVWNCKKTTKKWLYMAGNSEKLFTFYFHFSCQYKDIPWTDFAFSCLALKSIFNLLILQRIFCISKIESGSRSEVSEVVLAACMLQNCCIWHIIILTLRLRTCTKIWLWTKLSFLVKLPKFWKDISQQCNMILTWNK